MNHRTSDSNILIHIKEKKHSIAMFEHDMEVHFFPFILYYFLIITILFH